MRSYVYSKFATVLSALAVLSVYPASLIFVNNPEPPAELLNK